MRLTPILFLLVLCAVGVPAVSNGARLSPAVQQLADDYFNWRMVDKPEFATFVGIHDYDDQLNDVSLAAFQNRYDQCQVFLDQVVALEPNLTLHDDLVNIQVLKNELLTYMDGYSYQGFLFALTYMDGVHISIEQLVNWMVFETAKDYENLLSRYEKLPQQLSQVQALMEEGVAVGVVNHAIALKGVAESLGRYVVVAAEDSPLWPPLTVFPENITQDQINSFQDRGRTIILEQISPAYGQLRDYISSSYVTRLDIAVSSLPSGMAFYNQLLKFYTSISLTASEIHQLGLDEVARIEGEMAKIVEELGYNISVPEFSAMIRNDSQFFFDNPDDLFAGFEDINYNVIPPTLQEVFMNIPQAELLLVDSPSPDAPVAFYSAGSYDGSRPGMFHVNTYHYEDQPKYDMMTLSLHEGNPGHHLQASHSIESTTIPFFRRVMEDINYFEAPSRFPMNTAFVEGWGLYAESLGFDMDLYGDPYDRYGHYSYEIFRACRLVVDTGIHAFGWTRQEAIDYMFLHTALSLIDVENEIDRYIAMPGQAVAYKVGERKFTELRQKSRSELGAAFDIKKFHDIVLESVGPLDLVEDEINAWIDAGGGN